jgi:hypothetical protein
MHHNCLEIGRTISSILLNPVATRGENHVVITVILLLFGGLLISISFFLQFELSLQSFLSHACLVLLASLPFKLPWILPVEAFEKFHV